MIKKNLIFFMSDFSLGGAGNSITKLCLGLPKNNYKISIISIGKCSYSKVLKKNKINVFELNKKKLIFSIFELYHLLKKICKPSLKNILISNIHYNNIILTLIAKKISILKIVLVERTPLEELDIYFSKFDILKKKIIKFLINIIYPYSDLIIANSKGIKNGFNKRLKERIKVIYPPSIDKIHKFKNIRKKNSKFKVVCFSRLSIEKNLECAIRSFQYLKKENISLTIYGEGSLRKSLVNLINKLNLNRFVYIKKHNYHVQNDIRNFDLLISPSLFEGCSNSIIEAINYDLFVMASNCPGGNSEILYNEKFGKLFKTNDAYDLSLKIKKVMKNLQYYKNKSKKFKFTLKRFLKSTNIKNFTTIFEKV
jgi:glycosyltransferase involved in cell wall biosynthesis